MCRCPPEKKYMMIWAQKAEMDKTLKDVKEFNEKLKATSPGTASDDVASPTSKSSTVPDIAPGAEEDAARQKGKTIDLSCVFPPRYPLTAVGSKSNNREGISGGDAAMAPSDKIGLDDVKEAKRQKPNEEEAVGVGSTVLP